MAMKRLALVLTTLSALLLNVSALAADGPRVVVSIKPVHSLVAGLMRGVAEPVLVVKGAASPYEYQLSGDERKALNNADVVIRVGTELDGFLDGALAGSEAEVVELLDSPDLKILPARGEQGGRDPFFWLDSRNALILIDEMTRLLIRTDPAHEKEYRQNRSRVLADVAAIDRQLEYQYRDVSAVPVAMYYDTHQYFEQAYATSVVATASNQPGKPPSTAELLTTRSRMAQLNVHCFFTEAGLPTPYLDLLAGGHDITVAQLDSLGTGMKAGPDLYIELMRHNFNTMRQCVKPTSKALGEAHGIPDVSAGSAGAGTAAPLTGRFMLVDHNGNTVSNLDFLGKYQLVYFGYTFCPDICPTSLSVMKSALNLLGAKADKIQPIFITVDPQRDTPEVLAKYVAYFDEHMVGLTGPEAMIARTAKDFGVLYEKVPSEDGDPNNYSMDHSASLYLLDPQGQFVDKFAHGISPEVLAERLDEYL